MPMARGIVYAEGLVFGRQSTGRSLRLGNALVGAELAASVADPAALLHQATVAVAPLHQSNDVQRTVLEAMAAGVPVGATSGARQRPGGGGGRELRVAGAPEGIAPKRVPR